MDVEFKEVPYHLTEDEFLSSEYFYLKGDDIQKLSVIQALPQLLQTDPQQTYARIIPKILQELPNSSCEFHIMTSKVFRLLMERQVPVNLLHAVLQGTESRDPIVANAWMETLLAIVVVLNEAQIKNEIIPLANSKSLLNQPISARIASSRILGRVAVHRTLDSNDVKRDVLPLVQSLCQDCHPDVRTAMCIQLPHIAQGLGTTLVKANLLSSLVELSSDDNMYVRSAAVTSVVQMFPHTNLEIKKATILPLVKQLCERSMRTDDITATTVAREIGKLVDGLQFALSVNDCSWFIEYYRALSRRGLSTADEFRSTDTSMDVMCRQHCASNLSPMAYFTFASMPMHTETLYSIFKDLAADPCYIVRRTVAGCLHEVIKIFGPQSKLLKPDFVRLLRDDSEDVLQMLVPHMGNTLELFCTYGTLSRQVATQAALEIGRAMLKCQYELTNGYNWRLLTHFIHQLEHLPNCMPPDFIHQHFTPVVLTCAVQGRAKPVRSQAVRTLLVFLRYNGKEMQRKWLRDNMITQLCNSSSCYTRHIFIRLCVNAIDIFSEKYFKQYFFENLLDLADDPVANVRLCVADLFTVLRQMLALPEDKLLYMRLSEVFKKYTSEEKDRDVMEIFKRKMQEIGSMSAFSKDEHVKEQKRRIEEEERIAAGGKNLLFMGGGKKMTGKTSRNNSITKPSSSVEFTGTKTISQRSLSVPAKSSSSPNQTNDMSFLEQHFYIDAGVNLLTKPLSNTKLPSVGKLTNRFAAGLQVDESVNFPKQAGDSLKLPGSWSSNITDDDKVNLRKLTSSKNMSYDRKNKRYSSVFSATCLESNQERKVMNRRSLNVTAKEMSRIPVSNKSSPRKDRNVLGATENDASKATNENRLENDNNDNYTDIQETSPPVNKSGAKSKIISNNNGVSNDKHNLMSSGNTNGTNQSSPKSPSYLPVLKRRSQSEVRK